ncbi:hypothetical protein BJ742DRAFT_812188 [Cladochytrium replicatum]|nr:hypothetical protein BJ742DRAFT_812188 [Cladochytrium replicatum]
MAAFCSTQTQTLHNALKLAGDALNGRIGGASIGNTIGYVYSKEYADVSSRLPSNPDRSHMVHSLVHAFGLDKFTSIIVPVPADDDVLCVFHSREYVETLLTAEDEEIDEDVLEFHGLCYDCPTFEGLSSYVRLVAGASLIAAEKLRLGQHQVVIHWDGGRHHAKRQEASGFCYINDCILSIMELHKTFNRVLYLDIDVHHGDGVQEAFYGTSKVLSVSFHRLEASFFPGSGRQDEIGMGRGRNHSVNVPVPKGTRSPAFIEAFERVLETAVRAYDPEAVCLQCGADGLSGDTLVGCGGFKRQNNGWDLDIGAFAACVANVVRLGLPTIIAGGGGYHSANTARCWALATAAVIGSLCGDGKKGDSQSMCQCVDVLRMDIPEHTYFEEYGPDFTLQLESGISGSVSATQSDQNALNESVSAACKMLESIRK